MTEAAIVDYLIKEIKGGTYRPGDKLPATTTIAGLLGVKAHLVRNALAVLTAQGLVAPRPSSGHFVTGPDVPTVLFGPEPHRQVMKDIEEKITTGVYLPGAWLPPLRELAREYRMSVMPVRQAILRLNAEGILKTTPRVGTVVVRIP